MSCNFTAHRIKSIEVQKSNHVSTFWITLLLEYSRTEPAHDVTIYCDNADHQKEMLMGLVNQILSMYERAEPVA